MSDKQAILKSIYAVIDETNHDLPSGQRLEHSTDTVLFGDKGKLDSLGLVNFIVAVEQRIDEDFSNPVSLTDDKAMSQRNSPFRTVGTLVDYVASLLGDTSGG